MGTQGYEIVASGRALADFILEQPEHLRHGHGACAIRDEDQDTLTADAKLAGGCGNESAKLVFRQRALEEALADRHSLSPMASRLARLPTAGDRARLCSIMRTSLAC